MYAIKFPLTFIGAFLSILLILIILLRIPKENVGLASFANKSNVLGSPSSAERFLNIATITSILLYLAVALQLNILYMPDYILFDNF